MLTNDGHHLTICRDCDGYGPSSCLRCLGEGRVHIQDNCDHDDCVAATIAETNKGDSMNAKTMIMAASIRALRDYALETAARLRLVAGQMEQADEQDVPQLATDARVEISKLEVQIALAKQMLAHLPDTTKSATTHPETR